MLFSELTSFTLSGVAQTVSTKSNIPVDSFMLSYPHFISCKVDFGQEKLLDELYLDTLLRTWQFYNVNPERVFFIRFKDDSIRKQWLSHVKASLLDQYSFHVYHVVSRIRYETQLLDASMGSEFFRFQFGSTIPFLKVTMNYVLI